MNAIRRLGALRRQKVVKKWASCLARSPAAKSGFSVRSLPLLRNLLLSPTVYIIRSQLSIVFRCSRDLIGNNSGQDKTGFDPQMQGAPTFWMAGTSTGAIVYRADSENAAILQIGPISTHPEQFRAAVAPVRRGDRLFEAFESFCRREGLSRRAFNFYAPARRAGKAVWRSCLRRC